MSDTSNNTIQPYSAGISKLGAIKLSSNESPFPPSPAVQNAMIEAMRSAHIYPDMQQTPLKTAIADRHKVRVSNIVLGNGSGEILSFIARRILAPNSEVIISENTFSLYAISSQLAGAEIKKVALVDGYCNLDGMLRAITPRTVALFLPNPNNPTGTTHEKEAMVAFLKMLPAHVYVVLDEAYMDFADEAYHIEMEELFKTHERCIVLRTFSKLFALGGMRLGYGISTPEIIKVLEQAKLPFTVNRAVAAGANVALAERHEEEKNCNYIKRERAELAKVYQKMGLSFFPTQANFFCIALGTAPKDSGEASYAEHAFEFFANHNLMIRALTSFGMPHHIRITIGTHENNKKACATLAEFIKRTL